MPGFARVHKISASLGYPLSVFNKNSTPKIRMDIRHPRKKGKGALFVQSTNTVCDRFFLKITNVSKCVLVSRTERRCQSRFCYAARMRQKHTLPIEKKKSHVDCPRPATLQRTTHIHKKTCRHTYTHSVYVHYRYHLHRQSTFVFSIQGDENSLVLVILDKPWHRNQKKKTRSGKESLKWNRLRAGPGDNHCRCKRDSENIKNKIKLHDLKSFDERLAPWVGAKERFWVARHAQGSA